jgi:hypothetical protein
MIFFVKTNVQPTGFPFLIFKNIFKCLDFVILPFLDERNSKARRPDIRFFNLDFGYPKFKITFSNRGICVKFW